MLYPIVVSDLDGTLLSSVYTISPYTRETLLILKEKGIYIIFASGRHYIDVNKIQKDLNISSYMITSNGASVYDEKGNLILNNNIDPDIVKDLCFIDFFNSNVTINYYSGNFWFVNKPILNQNKFFKRSTFKYQLYDKRNFSSDNINKVYYTSNSYNELFRIEQKINSFWGDNLNVSFSSINCLEVVDGNVSKGRVLKRVVSLLGYNIKDCIAFGDGMNDYDMLKFSGKGCIMGNAHELLKKNLPYMEIIGTNDEDSVSKYLRNLYNI